MGFGLEGKVAMVTGGSSGIGKQTAFLLAENGADVVIVSRKNRLTTSDMELIRDKNLKIEYMPLDVADEMQVNTTVDSIVKSRNRIDILIHSASIANYASFSDLTFEQWKETIDINLNGSFLITKAVSEVMKKQKYGKIVIISSGSVITGTGGGAHYCASKAGQVGLMRSLANELSKFNINVNAIGPRSIETEMLSVVYDTLEKKQNLAKKVPLGRLGTPEDVANLAVFLASDLSSYITGQFIIIDGGRTYS